MAKFSLRRYDTQATVGLYCSLAAVLCLVAQASFIFRHFSMDEWVVFYSPFRRMAILGATAATIGMAVIGAALGFNSAGQRRNEKGQQSWIGFFTGALVISLSIAMFLFFMARGESTVL